MKRRDAFLLGAVSISFVVLAALFSFAIEENDSKTRTYSEPPIVPSDREHWAFRPIAVPTLPTVNQSEWPRTSIDIFVLHALESSKIEPAKQADSLTLLRRLKFDLLGLPVSTEEIDEYLAETEPDVYERWVDRFLASPRYGERWAQPWLDLARFAETDGFEHDRVRKNAWQYRDWVIESMNNDMPYDKFVFLQLAGESDPDSKHHVATMFSLAGPDMPDINDQELRRHDRLNEMTSTVGSSLLGMQFHCAQCHDHKYDPISQADFYRLRAVFEPAVPAFQRDQAFLLFAPSSSKDDIEARFYFRGEVRQPGPVVRPAYPRVVSKTNESIRHFDSENPRAEFARWLFEPANPLTARVIVNRLWQSHFGTGLFENPSDLGITAASPTNLSLLDWLATELQRNHWSLKSIQRLIVLSSTYRQASKSTEGESNWGERLRLDPDNRLYSRFPRHRLDAEMIRDAMLSVSGLIHFESGGQGVMPPLPAELVGTLLKGQWETSKRTSDHFRRSIYTFARRNLRYPILDAFDRPDAVTSCAKRDCSTTATQALQMLNGPLSLECSTGLRNQILNAMSHKAVDKSSKELEWTTQLFRQALGRPADESETKWVMEFLNQDEGDQQSRWIAACLAILNSNEFIYIE